MSGRHHLLQTPPRGASAFEHERLAGALEEPMSAEAAESGDRLLSSARLLRLSLAGLDRVR